MVFPTSGARLCCPKKSALRYSEPGVVTPENGRRLADVDNAALETTWAAARRAHYVYCWGDRWADYVDADTEPTLLRLPRVEHLISAESRNHAAAGFIEVPIRALDANWRAQG